MTGRIKGDGSDNLLYKAIYSKFKLLRYLGRISFFKNSALFLSYIVSKFLFKARIPSVAYIDVTFNCQFNCIFCGIAKYPVNGSELTTEEFKQAIRQLAMMKVPRVHFSGGEPLLRGDIDELVSYAHRKGLVTLLETNGYALSRERVISLKKHGLRGVCISLNASSEERAADYSGQKGIFSKVVAAIKLCEAEGMPCVASIVVRRELILSGELGEILRLAECLGVSGVRLITPRPMGSYWNNEEEILNAEERLQVRKLLDRTNLLVLGNGLDERICGVADLFSVFISPYGELQPCAYIPYSFGNIRSENINVILDRLSRHEMNAFIKSEHGCAIQNFRFREKYINCICPDKSIPIQLYE